MVSALPFDSTAREQSLVIRLVFALCVVSILACVMTLSTLYLYFSDEAYYLTSGTSGVARRGVLTEDFLYEYADDVVYARYSWSYLDFDAAQARFKTFLHPELLAAVESGTLKDEKRLAREYKMTSGIVILERSIVARNGLNTHLRLRALRHRWVGGTVDHDDLTIHLVLVPLTEHSRPKDMRLWSIADDVPLKVTGQTPGKRS